MYERFYSPNIMALASSQVGEDSLSVGAFFPFVNCIDFGMCSYFSNCLCVLWVYLLFRTLKIFYNDDICYSIAWFLQKIIEVYLTYNIILVLDM